MSAGLNRAVDRLADVVEDGHLLASTGGADLLIEAADTIERLTMERLTMELAELNADYQAAVAERDAARREVMHGVPEVDRLARAHRRGWGYLYGEEGTND